MKKIVSILLSAAFCLSAAVHGAGLPSGELVLGEPESGTQVEQNEENQESGILPLDDKLPDEEIDL